MWREAACQQDTICIIHKSLLLGRNSLLWVLRNTATTLTCNSKPFCFRSGATASAASSVTGSLVPSQHQPGFEAEITYCPGRTLWNVKARPLPAGTHKAHHSHSQQKRRITNYAHRSLPQLRINNTLHSTPETGTSCVEFSITHDHAV